MRTLTLLLPLVSLCAFAAAQSGFPVMHVFPGTAPNDEFGFAVATIGDIDGDTVPDFIVGAHLDDTLAEDAGSATVYSGRDGSVLHRFFGIREGAELGAFVSGAGDVNHDGTPDIIISEPLASEQHPASGAITVYSGADFTPLFSAVGQAANEGFGYAVDSAGDYNNDGYVDIIVGATTPLTAGMSYASVFSGADGALLQMICSPLNTGTDDFGFDVAGVGDVDDDGWADVAVGAPAASYANVYSGRTGQVLHAFNGDYVGDMFGWSVAGAGDIDGDGHDDVAISAPAASVFSAQSGQAGNVRIFSGADGSVLRTYTGQPGEGFGGDIDNAGDANGDGVDDLIVGAALASLNGNESGATTIYSGADGSIIFLLSGQFPGDHMGLAVSSAGDINGDGTSDFIIGMPWSDAGGPNSGQVVVMTACGVHKYGEELLTENQTLSLDWKPGDVVPATGVVEIRGGSAGSSGMAVVGLLPEAMQSGGVTFLVDPNPLWSFMAPVDFDGEGSSSISLTLNNPVLAGMIYYVQAVNMDPGSPHLLNASNGLQVLIGR